MSLFSFGPSRVSGLFIFHFFWLTQRTYLPAQGMPLDRRLTNDPWSELECLFYPGLIINCAIALLVQLLKAGAAECFVIPLKAVLECTKSEKKKHSIGYRWWQIDKNPSSLREVQESTSDSFLYETAMRCSSVPTTYVTISFVVLPAENNERGFHHKVHKVSWTLVVNESVLVWGGPHKVLSWEKWNFFANSNLFWTWDGESLYISRNN